MLCGIIGCCGVFVMSVLFIKVHVRIHIIINVLDVPMAMLVLLWLYCFSRANVRVSVIDVTLVFLRSFYDQCCCH